MAFQVPEQFRLRRGAFGSNKETHGLNGAFFVPTRPGQTPLMVIATDGQGFGWEHVSVSLPARCPTWEEMCRVKALFWSPDDTVMQLHPPESEWVNNHRYCLHLWRPTGADIPRPPQWMVGDPDLGVVK